VGKYFVMKETLHPRFCFRVSESLKIKISDAAKSQKRSKGRVVRDALEQYLISKN
jgi:predicted transcriptional regulator